MKARLLSIGVLAAASLAGNAAMAQEVITNPGRCAQYYPYANCENYGPDNPYRNTEAAPRNDIGWRDSVTVGNAPAPTTYNQVNRGTRGDRIYDQGGFPDATEAAPAGR